MPDVDRLRRHPQGGYILDPHRELTWSAQILEPFC